MNPTIAGVGIPTQSPVPGKIEERQGGCSVQEAFGCVQAASLQPTAC